MRPVILVATIAYLLANVAGCADEPTMPDPLGSPPGTPDGLWTVSGSSAAILRLDPSQLSETSNDAVTVITTPSARLNGPAAVAFDADGNLWVTGLDEPVLLAFDPEALGSSGPRQPRTTIVPAGGALRSPTGLAFDAQNRLWVADYTGSLYRFDVEQLATGGAQVPAVVLTVPGNPTAIAFDAGGSLWVSDNILHVIARYTPAQLAAPGSPLPDVLVSASDLSLVNPGGLAFDVSGNLWVANIGGRTLSSFRPEQLRRSGSPTPAVVITPTGGSLSVPVGLAFDAGGSLWVVGGAGALTKFSPASLGASGAAEPTLRVQIAERTLFWSIAFWPIPKGLPLDLPSP